MVPIGIVVLDNMTLSPLITISAFLGNFLAEKPRELVCPEKELRRSPEKKAKGLSLSLSLYI